MGFIFYFAEKTINCFIMKSLEWETRKVKVKDLIKLEINPRKITEEKRKKLIESLEKFNLVEIPAVNTDMKIIGGNQRVTALLLCGRGEEEIDVRYPNRKLTDKEVKEYCIISNTHAGEFDFDMLEMDFADIDFEDIGFDIEGLDVFKDKKEKENSIKKEKEELKPFKKAHILISYNPENHDKIIQLIEKLNKDDFEIEMGTN